MISNRRVALSVLFLVLIAAGFVATSVEIGTVDDDAHILVPIIGGLVGIASVFGLMAVLLHRNRDAASAEMAEWRDIRTAGRGAYIGGFIAKSVVPVLAGVLLSLGYTYLNGYPLNAETLITTFGLGIFLLAALALVGFAVWRSNEKRFAARTQKGETEA